MDDDEKKPENLWKSFEILWKKFAIKFWRPIIILLTLIILALTLLTYFGLFTVLKNMTSPVQTVTVSSEGPAAEIHPESMGQYNLLREVYRYDHAVYKHVDREDRFIIFTGRNLKFTCLYQSGCNPILIIQSFKF